MSTNLFDLTGKIALVSGASRGIGEEIARLLAEQGAHVIVSSRRIDDCILTAILYRRYRVAFTLACSRRMAAWTMVAARTSSSSSRIRLSCARCDGSRRVPTGAQIG